MRNLVVCLFVLVCIASIGNSYAQTPQNNLVIFAQIEIQDSSGNLVSYLEAPQITVLDMAKLNLLLDQNSPVFQKSFISNGNQKFEIIKATDIVIHPSATIVSQNTISASNGKTTEVLAIANHDGYPVVKGDKVTVYWTIIRPA